MLTRVHFHFFSPKPGFNCAGECITAEDVCGVCDGTATDYSTCALKLFEDPVADTSYSDPSLGVLFAKSDKLESGFFFFNLAVRVYLSLKLAPSPARLETLSGQTMETCAQVRVCIIMSRVFQTLTRLESHTYFRT